jgi:DNA-binding XRE family transcriptional regulator
MVNYNGRRPKTPGFGVQTADEVIACPHCNGTGKIRAENITIGNRFLICRRRLGKTQEQMAPSLKVSRAQLANLEGDRGRPGLETLVLAADAFAVTVDYLLGRKTT